MAASTDCLCYKYDVSLPFGSWQQLTRMVRSWDWGYTVGYGHAGDSNIHLNVCSPGPTPHIESF